jgi:hypothetical protein
MMTVTRSYSCALLAIGAVLGFTACVDLTPRWHQDAGGGGSGGGSTTFATGGMAAGGSVTGGTSSVATGGRVGGAVADAGFVPDAAPTGETSGTGGAGGVVAADAAGETRGHETGDTGGVLVTDAAADLASPREVGIDVPFSADTNPPSDLGTVALDAPETGDGPSTDGSGSSEAGETGGTGDGSPESADEPMIISIDFVGGRPNGTAGASGTVVMDPSESAGVKSATHWNSATGATGTLSSLVSASDRTTTASATWNVDAQDGVDTWSVLLTDASGDAHMMNGYLDPRASYLHATVTVQDLPDTMSSGYDVYVYCYSYMSLPDTFAYEFNIGTTTYSVTQKGPSASTFPGYQLAAGGDAGTAGEGNYVVFRHLTASSFTLTALPQPSGMGTERAPVNGIQIVYPSGY